MLFENGQTIVFTGDSTTDAGRKRPVGDGLWEGVGNGYVRAVDSILSVLYPERKLHIINTGTSGARSVDLLNVLDRDVLNFNPDWVFMMIGINDLWRQFDEPVIPYSGCSPEEYRTNMEKMISQIVPKVKGLFVMSPFFMEANDNDPMKIRTLEYSAIAKEIAEKYGARFIDLQKDFNEHISYRYPAYISWDRVHPSWVGSMIIARRILSEIGCEREFIMK